jgi:putative endonuclease
MTSQTLASHWSAARVGRRPALDSPRITICCVQPVDRPLGISGEALAEDHLRGLGYEIVARDVRTPLGQLDVVAMDGRTLVFVEVKTRAGHGFGLPQEAVDARKIRKLRQLGLYYVTMRAHRGPVRFDVVGLTVSQGRLVRVDHIKNAID